MRKPAFPVSALLAYLALLDGSATATAFESRENPSAIRQLADGQTPPNFTKIQDLNPNKQGVNRPVRQKWAVVIGVSKFADSRLDSADDAAKTARKFYDYLIDPKAGRFRADHVRLLTDEAASQQTINNSIGSMWLGRLAGPDDLVVVYIATKAFPTTDGNSYLCSYNCRLDNIYGTCMSIQSLMQLLKENVKSDRVVLVLESAYSGNAQLSSSGTSKGSTGTSAASASGPEDQKSKSTPSEDKTSSSSDKRPPGKKVDTSSLNVDLDQIALGKGFVILSSSAADQLSWKDLFSENLISALKEKDGLVSLDEAFAKTRKQTEYDSLYRMVGGKRQTPQLKSDWKGNDLVIGCVPVEETEGLPQSVLNFVGAEAHYLEANRAVIAGKLDDAMKEYKAAISTDPELTDAIADYAVALSMKGQWAEAETEMRKALSQKPKDVLYLTNYARILDKLGKPEDCKKALEKAYVLNPKDRMVLMALSDKCISSGDRQTAMQLIDQTLVLYPNNALAHDRMSFLLSMDGRTEDALLEAKEAVKLDPDLASAHLKLGSLFVIKGDTESGIKEYQAVLDKNPQNSDAHYLLAGALDKANDRQNAVKEYNRFLELAAPGDSRRAVAEDKLRALGSVITQ
ncbi:MAG: tetratricopeptide repeat protein [Candidatus Obscuribacterales bacterium]|nr:tetratricopeptide repeat protein [Candidatus Obscuribacterales bacterium]